MLWCVLCTDHRGRTNTGSCDTHGAIIPVIAMYIFTQAYNLRIFNIYTVFPLTDATSFKYMLGH